MAVKGIGGYHLAVDATDAAAVAELRRRKARDDKPFAVMVADLAAAPALCELDAPRERGAGLAPAADRAGAPAAGRRRWPTRSRPACPSSGSSCPTARSTTCSWPASGGRW